MIRLFGTSRRPFKSHFSPYSLKVLLTFPCLLLVTACGGGEAGIPAGNERLATLRLDATSPIAFGYLSSIRELSDGRILAADPNGQVLVRLDLDAGTVDTLGSQGAGPQEYEGPDQVFPLPGDSTLLVDLGNGRFITIDPEGTFVDWEPMSVQHESGQLRTVHPQFIDETNNLYTSAPYFLESPPDSTVLHKINRESGVETRVASKWDTEYVRRPRGAPRLMMVLYDDWAVGGDGRIAIVRANSYSLDWYYPDGRFVQGPAHEVERFPVGTPDMEAYMEFFAANATMSIASVGADGETQSMQMSRGLPPGTAQEIDDYEWPETLPLFRTGRTVVSPRGEAWVERYMPAGEPAHIDVFDDQGILLGFIELNPGAKVLGFGSGAASESTVYVGRYDDMGLIWLERHNVVRAEDRG